MTKTIIIPCSCYSETLKLSYECLGEAEYMDIAIYGQRYSTLSKLSIWERIKRSAQILWNGKEYSDQIVIDKEDISKLIEFFKSIDQSKPLKSYNEFLSELRKYVLNPLC